MKKEIEKSLQENSTKAHQEDINNTLKNEHKIKQKLKDVPKKFKKLTRQVKLFLELVKDFATGEYEEIPWGTLSIVLAALAYFLAPIDIIPDIFPAIGFFDDALFLTTAIKYIQEDLRHYCIWKGKDPKEYF